MTLQTNELRMEWTDFLATITAEGVDVAYMVETCESEILCAWLTGCQRFCFCYVAGDDHTAFDESDMKTSAKLVKDEGMIRGAAYSASVVAP